MLIPTANLATILLNTAARCGGRSGLVRGDQVASWDDLARAARGAAAALAAAGIGHGDRVLVHGRNSRALFESLWACWMIGATWVPTNVRLAPPEVAYLASNAGAAAHLFDDGYAPHRAAARDANPALRREWSLGADWPDLAAHPPLEHPATVDRDHPAWLFYTSGTTGRPKGAVLTHGQLAFVVNNHLCDLMPGTTEADTSLVVAPLSHGAGIHALAQVAAGAASILPQSDRLDPEEAWHLVERHRVANMFTVPTILTALTRHDAVDRYDHRSLRHVIYAGAPMYRADQVHALRKLGPVLVQYFGLGEVTGNITVLPPRLHAVDDDPAFPLGSVGFPRTGMDVAILGDDGARLGPGETGEICVRGQAVFAGYWDQPEATATALRNGWFHTGDLGHQDARGFLWITGRRSDMFISGGSNVYPREIEEALLLHPAVSEACVVGMPDQRWGETGVAVIVLHPGHPADEPTLLAHLQPRLARYKHPSRILFWDELPKSGYGKVPKPEVKRLLTENPLPLGEGKGEGPTTGNSPATSSATAR